MPVTYTNRKGFTYFLCKGETKTGKPRYYFARDPRDEAVGEIPQGYQIEESVNGIVSLVKVRPRLIPPEESAIVEAALKRHPKGRNYRVSVKNNQIVIYEMVGGEAIAFLDIINRAGMFPANLQKDEFQERMERLGRFTPVMRFILDDQGKREYHAERWCYKGSIDDWVYVGHSGKIELLARKLIPTLGTDDFFELY